MSNGRFLGVPRVAVVDRWPLTQVWLYSIYFHLLRWKKLKQISRLKLLFIIVLSHCVISGKSKTWIILFFNLPRFAHHADDAASLRNHLWAGSMLLLIPDKNTKSFDKTVKLRVIIKKPNSFDNFHANFKIIWQCWTWFLKKLR